MKEKENLIEEKELAELEESKSKELKEVYAYCFFNPRLKKKQIIVITDDNESEFPLIAEDLENALQLRKIAVDFSTSLNTKVILQKYSLSKIIDTIEPYENDLISEYLH